MSDIQDEQETDVRVPLDQVECIDCGIVQIDYPEEPDRDTLPGIDEEELFEEAINDA